MQLCVQINNEGLIDPPLLRNEVDEANCDIFGFDLI